MNDSQWDEKLKSFLKKTGDDFKRFGTDVKDEAQKLLSEVQDPKRQEKLREGLKDVGVWAKKTAEEVATFVETGVKKAEGAIGKASDKVNDLVGGPLPQAPSPAKKAAVAPAATPPSPPPVMDTPAAAAPKKTVGKGAPKKKAPAPKSGAKKTIGKKRPS